MPFGLQFEPDATGISPVGRNDMGLYSFAILVISTPPAEKSLLRPGANIVLAGDEPDSHYLWNDE